VFDSNLLKRAVPKKQRELERFAELINDLREKAGSFGVSDLLVAVMEESGYLRELQADETPDGKARVEEPARARWRCARVRGQPRERLDHRRLPLDIALISDIDTLDPSRRSSPS